jgi:hypothetical protein
MNSSLIRRLSARATLPLFALLAIAELPACRSSASSGDLLSCPVSHASGTPEDGSFANGTVSGSGLSASFCYAGIQLLGSQPGGKPSFVIDSTSGATTSSISIPANAVGPTLSGTMAIAALAPGVYKSTDTANCGSVAFTYGTLVDPAGACSVPPSANYSCPAGCTINYNNCPDASFGQACCIPLATTYVYQASGAACSQFNGPQAPEGSWTLTLTSVTSYADGATQYGEALYTAHGSFTATMKGTADTTGTGTLSLTF